MKEGKDSEANDNFSGPARYRIVVRGTVPERWSERLAGMKISYSDSKTGEERTTLLGQVRDQAELNGVLETLYSLRLSIIGVKKVKDAAK